ncbi:MAG: BrnT family toxin [Prevotellaceae bacterium]|jgi:uncharacterized DUF497 family protein|nr:BrnT family toxin [Prevotellaceae bacterium]
MNEAMTFEWDENKRLSNLAKHGLDFADALRVFQDPYRKDDVDDRKNYGEARVNTIGVFIDEVIIVVTHTNRNSVTRLISARRANKKERRNYYGNR